MPAAIAYSPAAGAASNYCAAVSSFQGAEKGTVRALPSFAGSTSPFGTLSAVAVAKFAAGIDSNLAFPALFLDFVVEKSAAGTATFSLAGSFGIRGTFGPRDSYFFFH